LQSGKFCDTSDSLPSGLLTLSEGLMRSCDPYFWHIGIDLYRNNRAGDISTMANAFGLGAPTGIEIEEEGGLINVPTDELGATNQAIGQGDMQVTTLQVARFMAAIGNGGTLYRPSLIEKIVGPDGKVIESFAPNPVGKLPLQPERLTALQEAMVCVIRCARGTANFRLRGLNIAAAGKTGTAQTGNGLLPHAWFAGYTFANIAGVPDIAVAVMLENAGEGSDYAAPVFKRILEAYFYGSPQSLYWYESNFGMTRTPTPFGGIPTKTPKPRP
jgi:penicillin-binding protein 2